MFICTKTNSRQTSMCFIMTKIALAIRLWSVARTISVRPIYFTGRNTMHQSKASIDCILTLQNMKIRSTFVSDAWVTFYRWKFSRVTRSFAPETTSCRCSNCFQRLAQNRRIWSYTITVLHHCIVRDLCGLEVHSRAD